MSTATKSGPTLSELSEEIHLLLANYLDPETGEISDEGSKAIDEWNIDVNDKIQRVAAFIRGQIALADSRKAEAEYLTKRAKAAIKKADQLKDYLLNSMESMGMKESKGVFNVKVAVNPPKVYSIDEMALPGKYKVTVPATEKIDKKAILADHKDGEYDIPGVEIVRGKSIRIR